MFSSKKLGENWENWKKVSQEKWGKQKPEFHPQSHDHMRDNAVANRICNKMMLSNSFTVGIKEEHLTLTLSLIRCARFRRDSAEPEANAISVHLQRRKKSGAPGVSILRCISFSHQMSDRQVLFFFPLASANECTARGLSPLSHWPKFCRQQLFSPNP